MNLPSQKRRFVSAFTLVELLTVIAIIAILMGLLFPAIGVVKEQARKVQAKNDVTQIVASVKQYYTEYGKYPPVAAAAAAAPADTLVGDTVAKAIINNNALFDTLRSIDRGLNAGYIYNPRRIVFFEGRGASDVNAPRAGFADNSTDPLKLGNFYDPWGMQYSVVMDADYDNQINIDAQYTDFAADKSPRVGVGVFSMGKDNMLGNAGNNAYKSGTTTSDDVISWQ